ncbi:phenylalanine--tRNA ligase subunit beta [Candidatus Erwinia haradaeae]|uniref:Phenylalanine--tRNA ligase beta subunit n=1 Tax=Candidatus Erwinia haradaeae TaxID=1922217 RepID=A0A803FSZ4_9GAMM|nr:phenylalanine--tRNA ligase subunit beta [Candidatus Erwinia haradaeae]VFP87432.1 Phenylalanine--tRNA ligase beta subunit [Candidatus Erwinia haradaeae]
MKFSELWLREWVNPEIDTSSLCTQLSMAGLAVNRIEEVLSHSFSEIIVGQIEQCFWNPHAEFIYMTKVNIGIDRLLDIPCSASNCRQGLKVAVGRLDDMLSSDIKFKVSRLSSQSSHWMLCTFSQLGLILNKDGIIELSSNAILGANICQYLRINDNIIDVSITPNRGDCLSILGIAREISVINRIALNEVDIFPITSTLRDLIQININDIEACPRYLARVIKLDNLRAKTPFWMQEKLRRCGIRSLNPVVDVTNYILFELGQPMHAFDRDRIVGVIVVRYAKEGEIFKLFDGNEIRLSTDTLVVADEKKILAMAGISGGQDVAITLDTNSILLECAFFSPLAISGRARKYGLFTEASNRFERGVDSELQNKAIERATSLLLTICGGAAGSVIDITTQRQLPHHGSITLYRVNLDRLIGNIIKDTVVSDILQQLGCRITKELDYWVVRAPSWRFDLVLEEDLIEEIIRIYGYNNISNISIKTNVMISRRNTKDLSLKRAKTLLVDRGYQEAITYSFVNPKLQKLLHPGDQSLALLNPVSVEMSVMRLSLWTGLLGAVLYNQNRQQFHIRFFETGLRFIPDIKAKLGVRQELILAGAVSGYRYVEHWDLPNSLADFYDVKGDLESLFELISQIQKIEFIPVVNSAFHPGQCAGIYSLQEYIGCIGVINPIVGDQLGLKSCTIMFEILWDKVLERALPYARSFSPFPSNRRDISVIVPEHVLVSDVLKECRNVGGEKVVYVNLFDIYRGKGIVDGFKSLAISIILQDIHRTLQEKDINVIIGKCIAALEKRFEALLRDERYGSNKS